MCTADSLLHLTNVKIPGDGVALVVLLAVVHLALHQLHHVPTVALDQVGVPLQDVHLHDLLHLIQVLGVEHRLYLIVMDHFLALRTRDSLRFLNHPTKYNSKDLTRGRAS